MPYCPKCDMEFVEGVTECSDCHGPLVESEEAYREQLKQQRSLELETEAWPDPEVSLAGPALLPEDFLTEDVPEADQTAEREPAVRSAAFVSASQRLEDLRSSASAFFLVGGVALALSLACWAGILRLPMADGSRLLLQTVLTLMGLLFLFIAFRTRNAVAAMKVTAANEEKQTEELCQWFLASWSGSALDQEVRREASDLSEPELALKRFELIQDHLITSRDLPDPAYVDYVSDKLYERLYPEQSVSESQA